MTCLLAIILGIAVFLVGLSTAYRVGVFRGMSL